MMKGSAPPKRFAFKTYRKSIKSLSEAIFTQTSASSSKALQLAHAAAFFQKDSTSSFFFFTSQLFTDPAVST